MSVTRIVTIDGDRRTNMIGETKYGRQAEYYGKSTDTKPIEGVNNADLFYEMDKTKNSEGETVHRIFMFDADAKEWIEQ